MPEQEQNSEKLVMRFDPRTIEHLGIKMYSRVPSALAELIANSYDAKAKEVIITLEDGENKKISVKDDGEGMLFKEINDKFLIIGRNRREEEGVYSSDGKRKVTGKKGLGKLALFGIGDTINIETIKNGEKVTFELDWNKLKSSSKDYRPESIRGSASEKERGTKITLTNLKRESDLNAKDLAISLSKLFNFFDKNFKVFVKKGETISYNETFAAPQNMTIGIIGAGYYEGLDRRLSNKGFVTVDGVSCQILGRVCMNITIIDLSKVSNPYIGQECIIYSRDSKQPNSIQNCANICQTIPYDLLVKLNETVKREVVE